MQHHQRLLSLLCTACKHCCRLKHTGHWPYATVETGGSTCRNPPGDSSHKHNTSTHGVVTSLMLLPAVPVQGAVWLHQRQCMDAGWQYKGSFINGQSKPFGKHDLGAMWECPFLTPLQEPSALLGSSAAPGSNGGPQTLREDQQYMMCVSPYPHHLKDRLTNPCLYWLGYIQQELFQIAESDGQSLLHLPCIAHCFCCWCLCEYYVGQHMRTKRRLC